MSKQIVSQGDYFLFPKAALITSTFHCQLWVVHDFCFISSLLVSPQLSGFWPQWFAKIPFAMNWIAPRTPPPLLQFVWWNPQCDSVWRWDLVESRSRSRGSQDRISEPRECACSPALGLPCEGAGEGSHLQARKRALTGSQPCWHLDFGLQPKSKTMKK